MNSAIWNAVMSRLGSPPLAGGASTGWWWAVGVCAEFECVVFLVGFSMSLASNDMSIRSTGVVESGEVANALRMFAALRFSM